MTDLEFWTKVRKEYEINKQRVYLCGASPTFGFVWVFEKSERNNILSDTKLFLENSGYKDWFIGTETLFVTDGPNEFYKNRNIRIDFIDWCIKKYSN